MSILDTTIVNVALATLGRELHSTIAQIQWVVTGYMLALLIAACVLDRLREMFYDLADAGPPLPAEDEQVGVSVP
jgi:MFS family permease